MKRATWIQYLENFSCLLSIELTVVYVDQMENRKHCSEIAKLKGILLVRIWSRIFVWGSLIPPTISPQKKVVFLFEIYRKILEQNLLQNC